MKVLDLFSGIGGFSLGLERAGMETVAFCEIEPFCQKVLAKHWPDVPIYSDIQTLTAERLKDDGITADVVCGGYPCQPFSHAGKREGEKDDRHLWPEMYRIIETVRPRWVIAENVAGHITMGLDAVLSDLEAANYAWWTFVIPACAVDAKHRRDRVWIIAQDDSNSHITGSHRKAINQHGKGESTNGKERESGQVCEVLAGRGNAKKRGAENVAHATKQQRNGSNDNARVSARPQEVPESENGCGAETMADTKRQRQQGQGQSFDAGHSTADEEGEADSTINVCEPRFWPIEPNVGRVVNGISNRVDRLKSLGNAVVPQVVEVIGRAIMETQE